MYDEIIELMEDALKKGNIEGKIEGKIEIAKNLLYQHYSNYAYFNERKKERYSK